jgi:NAD+ dependent glucose-6-phosphate dehydrogenase
MPQKVLVTGATGQIGYMTFTAMHEQPDRFDAYAADVRKSPSDRVPGAWTLDIPDDRFTFCDLADYDAAARVIDGMDIVVHLAADPEGHTWDSVLHNNVIATYNVFEAARQAGVQRIVAASSIMVSQGHREQEPYRALWERRHDGITADVTPVSPDIPAEPRSLYGASKVWTESLARVYADRHDISCICIRIGQVERDRPRPPQGADIYVSQRDIVQIITRAVAAPPDLRFGIYYGMSDNDLRWVDIEGARCDLGYEPQDRAEEHHDYD